MSNCKLGLAEIKLFVCMAECFVCGCLLQSNSSTFQMSLFPLLSLPSGPRFSLRRPSVKEGFYGMGKL